MIIRELVGLVFRLLAQCVIDPAICVGIWDRTIRRVRLSRNHPELRFDLSRGNTRGFVIAIALHYAYRWLVWHENPANMAD
jgi:hypothetical protein